jgi:hypothetical protein
MTMKFFFGIVLLVASFVGLVWETASGLLHPWIPVGIWGGLAVLGWWLGRKFMQQRRTTR